MSASQLAASKNGSENAVPTVHLEFIQNQAMVPQGEGLKAIEDYHRSLFLHQHAKDLERYQQQSRIHGDRLAHLEIRLKDAQARLSTLERLVPVSVEGELDIRPSSPWNLWDRAMFGAAAVAILTLLVFGILNISFNLLESGLVTFIENPVRAYLWAALLPVGALAVKIGWDFLQARPKRDLYLWACLAIGIIGVLVWVGAYATVYPTLSKTTDEHIQSLSVFDQNTEGSVVGAPGTKWVDVMIVSSQATAEIFLSAVLGIYMTILYARHRPVRLAANPLFTQLDEERRGLEEDVARERLALAEARGNESRLDHQLTALVTFAKAMFQKEASLREDQAQQKRILLDQISEQIRTQLDHFSNGRGTGTHSRALTLDPQNGK